MPKKKGSIGCSSTSSLVALDVMSSVFKPFCKAGCVRVFKVEVALPWSTQKFRPTEFSFECLVVIFGAEICGCDYKQTKTPANKTQHLISGKAFHRVSGNTLLLATMTKDPTLLLFFVFTKFLVGIQWRQKKCCQTFNCFSDMVTLSPLLVFWAEIYCHLAFFISSVILNILASLSAIAVEYFIFLGSEHSEKRHLALSCNRYQCALVVQ